MEKTSTKHKVDETYFLTSLNINMEEKEPTEDEKYAIGKTLTTLAYVMDTYRKNYEIHKQLNTQNTRKRKKDPV